MLKNFLLMSLRGAASRRASSQMSQMIFVNQQHRLFNTGKPAAGSGPIFTGPMSTEEKNRPPQQTQPKPRIQTPPKVLTDANGNPISSPQ